MASFVEDMTSDNLYVYMSVCIYVYTHVFIEIFNSACLEYSLTFNSIFTLLMIAAKDVLGMLIENRKF